MQLGPYVICNLNILPKKCNRRHLREVTSLPQEATTPITPLSRRAHVQTPLPDNGGHNFAQAPSELHRQGLSRLVSLPDSTAADLTPDSNAPPQPDEPPGATADSALTPASTTQATQRVPAQPQEPLIPGSPAPDVARAPQAVPAPVPRPQRDRRPPAWMTTDEYQLD